MAMVKKLLKKKRERKTKNILEVTPSDSSKMKQIKKRCITLITTQSKISKVDEILKHKLSKTRKEETEERIHKYKQQYNEAFEKLNNQIEEDTLINISNKSSCSYN